MARMLTLRNMTIDIPDTCECEDDLVCSKCTWETACAIVEANQRFDKLT